MQTPDERCTNPQGRCQWDGHHVQPCPLEGAPVAGSVAAEIAALRAEADRRLAERDDVIRELAGALVMMREIAPDKTVSDDAFHTHGWADKALARVDAMTGGER